MFSPSWEPLAPCGEEIPDDACSVNYCPEVPCEYENLPTGINLNVTARLDEDGDAGLDGCIVNLAGSSNLLYPSLEVAINGETELRDGSHFHQIDIPIEQSSNIENPLVLNVLGEILQAVPNPVFGKRRIIANGSSMTSVPYVFPLLMKNNLEEDSEPVFFLGARAVNMVCTTTNVSETIQLLKIIDLGV